MVRIGEVGQNGDFRCLGLWQGGEFAQLQWLDREPQPVISDLRRMLCCARLRSVRSRSARRACPGTGPCRTGETPSSGSDRLRLRSRTPGSVRLRSLRSGTRWCSGSLRHPELLAGPVQRIEKPPAPRGPCEAPPERNSKSITLRRCDETKTGGAARALRSAPGSPPPRPPECRFHRPQGQDRQPSLQTIRRPAAGT